MNLRRLRKRLLLLVPVSILAVAGTAPPANAALDMYMRFSDGIEGESQAAGHAKDVDVLAWSWGASRSEGTRSKAASANFQELSITKYLDKSSTKLLRSMIAGETITSASLTVDKAGANPYRYERFCMRNVTVQSISAGGSGGEDRFTENVTLAFHGFTMEYTPAVNGDPSPSPVFVSYDLVNRTFGSNTC
jgi:type VI secretion system secreted protein Hcp